jgi:membrane protein DedA with SNARE-associated domain
MQFLLDHLRAVGGGWVYAVVALLVFGEAGLFLGMVLPGETALLVGGFLAHRGVVHLVPVLVVGVAAAVLGDSTGYALGRYLGPRLRGSRLGRRIGADRWQRADAFLRRHGGRAVFLGRWTALLRSLVPFLAGMSHLPYRTFLVWNAAGGVLWGTACVLLGYAFSQSLDVLGRYLGYTSSIVLALVVLGFLGHRGRRRRREREQHQERESAEVS